MDKQEFFEKVKSYADERHMTCELKDNWFDKADWSVIVKKRRFAQRTSKREAHRSRSRQETE